MKKNQHFIIMAESYYPNMTMCGKIAKNIADTLKECGHKVSVVSYKNHREEMSSDEIEYVPFWSVYLEKLIKEKMFSASSRIERSACKFFLQLKRICSFVIRNVNKYGLNERQVSKIVSALEKLHKIQNADYVISIAAPFEFQKANYEFALKHTNVCCIAYQVDFWVGYEDKRLPNFMRIRQNKSRIRLQNRIAQVCDLVMQEAVFYEEGTVVSANKVRSVCMPLLIEKEVIHKRHQDTCVRFVYAGTLNYAERNPSKLIELLVQLAKRMECQLDFYHTGNCEELIKKASESYPTVIIDHGTVSSEVADRAICEADVLVIISTNDGKHIAGKNFECLATCKKILYIFFTDTDINAKLLKDYPLALCINMSNTNMEQCIRELELFVGKKEPDFCFSDVAKIYEEYLPKNVCRRLIESDAMRAELEKEVMQK